MKSIAYLFLYASIGLACLANANPVGITPDKAYVEVKHNGKTVRIERNQDNKNKVKADYALTSRFHQHSLDNIERRYL